MAAPSSSSSSSSSRSSIDQDQIIRNQLEGLRKQVEKKQTFQAAVSSLKSLLLESYSSSSPPTRKLFYDVVCRVATVLCTRYTAAGFLAAGADLLEAADALFADQPAEKTNHLKSCISTVRHELNQSNRVGDGGDTRSRGSGSGGGSGGYLFEGHLTVDREPPLPNWLIRQNLLTALVSQVGQSNNNGGGGGSGGGDYRENLRTFVRGLVNGGGDYSRENLRTLVRGLVNGGGGGDSEENLRMLVRGIIDRSMMERLEEVVMLPLGEAAAGGRRRVAPPASKEVVEKLPVMRVDEEGVLGGEEGECCICKEKLEVGDEMQELPCKDVFHPPCLKPWLEEHNCCPICRHELPTDVHKYESWKERELELEEERRGAANAVRAGELMYG